jgi:hypothetical protein
MRKVSFASRSRTAAGSRWTAGISGHDRGRRGNTPGIGRNGCGGKQH